MLFLGLLALMVLACVLVGLVPRRSPPRPSAEEIAGAVRRTADHVRECQRRSARRHRAGRT